jgi:hypothetical protein
VNVNFEFLGDEPIENVITCMHFKMDKVVFFGYYDTVSRQRENTEIFLRDFCNVPDVVFHVVSQKDIHSVENLMRREIERELAAQNRIYFDITGGESLILVSLGILSREYKTPMHVYDIPSDKLIELEEDAAQCISKNVPAHTIPWDLDTYIRMWGGVINSRLHKGGKDVTDPASAEDVTRIWEVARTHWDDWNSFSRFLRENFLPDGNLDVKKRAGEILRALQNADTNFKTPRQLNALLDVLEEAGVLLHVIHSDGQYAFRYKSREVKDCLWDGGSILELHTYLEEKQQCDDCRIGVHLDWDGIIHSRPGEDVLNEIDVLTLKGNVPTFISCKSGKVIGNTALYAMYELETVADRFGGKYARKILKITQPMNEVYLERAKEMGIVVEECEFVGN